MTVEEFDRLPEPRGGYLELRHGQPVIVPFANMRHARLQVRVQSLSPLLPDSVVTLELAFGRTHPEGWLAGSPEFVVEVVSPSNTSDEMDDREQAVLGGGAKEFWVVYPAREQVRVATSAGRVRR